MRWLRTNRRAGGAFALLALFLQLSIGLTHIHANANAHGQSATPDVAPVSLAGDLDHAASDEHPSHKPHGGITCDLCILLHAATFGDVATPPVLATPFAAPVLGLLAFSADPPADAARRFLPQSRAPPAA